MDWILWDPGLEEPPNFNPVTQFLGRVTITSNQLRIGSTQLRDAGNYSVEVTPVGTTGQTSNSRSVQLRVFGKR